MKIPRINSMSRSQLNSSYSDEFLENYGGEGDDVVYESESDVTSNSPTKIPDHKKYGNNRRVVVGEFPEKVQMSQHKAAKIISRAVRGRQM